MSRAITKAMEKAPIQRTFRGLSPEQRQSQRRTQLMEAGIEVFGTRGFHSAGVREICAVAKLTERYFYESFQNREALFVAVYQAATAQLEAKMLAAIMQMPPDADITRVGLRAVLETFRDDPRIARIVLIEVLTLGQVEVAFEVSQTFASTIERLATALYPGLEHQPLQARILANGLYGSTIYVAQRWTLEGFKDPLPVILDHCALFYEAVAAKMGVAAVQPKPAKRNTRSKR